MLINACKGEFLLVSRLSELLLGLGLCQGAPPLASRFVCAIEPWRISAAAVLVGVLKGQVSSLACSLQVCTQR